MNASPIERVMVVDPIHECGPTTKVSQPIQEVTLDDPTIICQSSSSRPKRLYRSRVVVPLRVAEKHTQTFLIMSQAVKTKFCRKFDETVMRCNCFS